MLRHFTGVKDIDLYLFMYCDDRDLASLSKTCKYFRGLLEFDNLFWKERIRRLFQLNNDEFTHIFSGLHYDSCWKNYYTRVLSDQRRIFREWTKTSAIINAIPNHLVNPNLPKITELAKDGRLDLLMYVHMASPTLRQLIRDAITATSPNLIKICFNYGRIKILEWLVDMGYTSITPNMNTDDTINPVSLWNAVMSCQLLTLNYYKDIYEMVPYPAEHLDDGYRTVWYNTAISLLKLDKASLLAVLNWFVYNQLVDTGLKIILNEIITLYDVLDCPYDYQQVIMDWCKQNQINLCTSVNTDNNPYILAYRQPHKYYKFIRIFNLLYKSNMKPTVNIVRILESFSDYGLSVWLREKNLV